MSKPPVRKGGRPSKPTDEKRTHVVTIKLNDAEYSDLLVRSKTATKSQFRFQSGNDMFSSAQTSQRGQIN